MYAAAATFICMLIHLIHDLTMTDNFLENLLTFDTLDKLVDAFIVSVSIIVVAVP